MRFTQQLVSLLVLASSSTAFVPQYQSTRPACLAANAPNTATTLFASLLSLELEKPLGILLEEVEEDCEEV